MRNYSHKYGAKSVVIGGIRFPSTGEGNRYLYLKDCARRGIIRDLQLQVPFELYPPIYEPKLLKRGPRKGQTVNGRLLWEGITYISDFVYTLPDGTQVVEDFKGVQTPVFKIKRRLLKERCGIELRVVIRPSEPVGLEGVHYAIPGAENVLIHPGNVPFGKRKKTNTP